jgi:hypothetical protein
MIDPERASELAPLNNAVFTSFTNAIKLPPSLTR